MKEFLPWAKRKLLVDKRLILTYCTVYLIWGLGMNWFGTQMEIAKFTYWWQVITCYIFYMVPISLLLRGFSFHKQYAYGLIAMCLLELSGYALKTSYAYPGNIIESLLGQRSFGLAMALFFALYFPLGNWLVERIYGIFFKR